LPDYANQLTGSARMLDDAKVDQRDAERAVSCPVILDDLHEGVVCARTKVDDRRMSTRGKRQAIRLADRDEQLCFSST
jgi:hypothetical protein